MELLGRSTQRRQGRGRRGVTLVEVLIALFVLTVGVLSVIALFPSGYSLSQGALDRTVAALAARDAVARILSESKDSSFDFPEEPNAYSSGVTTIEPLYLYYHNGSTIILGVPETHRVGTIASVSAHSLTCRILGNVTPSTSSSSSTHWPNLAGRFFVLTSGAAANGVYCIDSSSGGTVNFDSSRVTFRTGSASSGIPVRVGDNFAIIGNKSGEQCFPASFLSPGSSGRTIPIATQGDPDQPWNYSYGCIISASAREHRHLYRVDVFVFRNFDNSLHLEVQDRPVGHFVTYIHNLEGYGSP